MKAAALAFHVLLAIVLAVILTRAQYDTIAVVMVLIAFIGFGAWGVLGTLWWMFGLIFRRGK